MGEPGCTGVAAESPAVVEELANGLLAEADTVAVSIFAISRLVMEEGKDPECMGKRSTNQFGASCLECLGERERQLELCFISLPARIREVQASTTLNAH